MKITWIKIFVLTTVLFTGVLLNGCSTAHGFGDDLEGAGKDLKHEADSDR